jgi:PadR family transcriptional regulator PadR
VRRSGHARAARYRGRGHGAPPWLVRARIERVVEPGLLLLLRARPAHGYELAAGLAELLPGERVDGPHLYRILRALESEGLVRSEWNADAPGPARRTYELTDEGRRLLDAWAAALERTRDRIDTFLTQYRGST